MHLFDSEARSRNLCASSGADEFRNANIFTGKLKLCIVARWIFHGMKGHFIRGWNSLREWFGHNRLNVYRVIKIKMAQCRTVIIRWGFHRERNVRNVVADLPNKNVTRHLTEWALDPATAQTSRIEIDARTTTDGWVFVGGNREMMFLLDKDTLWIRHKNKFVIRNLHCWRRQFNVISSTSHTKKNKWIPQGDGVRDVGDLPD